MHERIKEHDRDVGLARTQTSAVSKHAHKTGHYPLWNEVKFIDRDRHWYTRRVKEAIHIRLHPDNINRDSGIEIPEAWMPTMKKHNKKTVQQRTTEGTTSRQNSEDRNAPITAHQRDINGTAKPVDLIARRRLAVSSRNVAIYNSSNYIVRQTIIHLLLLYLPR